MENEKIGKEGIANVDIDYKQYKEICANTLKLFDAKKQMDQQAQSMEKEQETHN